MKKFGQRLKRTLALLLAALLLLTAGALADTAIVVKAGAQVYGDAKLSKKLGTLPKLTLVEVNAASGKVAQLTYADKNFYMKADALKLLEDVAVPAEFSSDSRVYEAPDVTSRSAAVKAGYKVNLLYASGVWALLERDGKLGYAPASIIQEIEEAPEAGDDPFLPDAQTQPSTKGDVVIETVGAQVIKDKLPVYQSANTRAKLLGTLKKGQIVTVYAYNAGWAYIGVQGKRGFCQRVGLKRSAAIEEQPSDDLSGAVSVTVTASSVKAYQKADEKSKLLATLQKGVKVNLLSVSDGWAYIELNGKYGYCAADALNGAGETAPEPDDEKDDAPQEVIGDKSPLGSATVIETSARIYEKMSTSSAYVSAQLGETLNFYGYDSKWVLVGRDGSFGFMQRGSLNAESYSELQNEDSGAAVQELQQALLALGYLDGTVSGNYNDLTVKAVERLQAACGLTQSGKANAALLRVLYSGNAPVSPMLSASLAKGAVNDNVTRLQTRLHALGYFSRTGSIDGDYGTNTAAAVRLFQSAAGISASGTADNATIRALYTAKAPTLEAGKDAADAEKTNTGSSSGNTTTIDDELDSDTSSYEPSMSASKKIEHVIYCARQQLGKRYVFGAVGMSTFDCSGLTMYAFGQVGVSLPHSAYSQGYNDSRTKISSISKLRRGDMVFFNTVSDGDQCDHVGIYLGSNQFIHASSGAGKVVISDLSSGYYNRVFSWGRRVLS